MVEKKLTLNDILKEALDQKLFSKKDKVFGLIELSDSEAKLLKKKHSTRKHVNWMTKNNDKFKWKRSKRKVIK